jgi:hypothetical protein
MASRTLRRCYPRRNESLAVDVEQDAILIGLISAVAAVAGYLLWQKITSTGATVAQASQDWLNETFGPGEYENTAPGNSTEPEDQEWYE